MIVPQISNRRRGVTLVELLVAIVLLALIATISVASRFRSGGHTTNETSTARFTKLAAEARRHALRSGQVVVVSIPDSTGTIWATALPDGSVLADTALRDILPWDRLIGAPLTSTTKQVRQR